MYQVRPIVHPVQSLFVPVATDTGSVRTGQEHKEHVSHCTLPASSTLWLTSEAEADV